MSTVREYTSALQAGEAEILNLAKQAGEHIDRGDLFKSYWLHRGRGLVTARNVAMRMAHSQDPKNKRYRNIMSEIMADHGLDKIASAERHRLFQIMAQEEQVLRWYDSQASNQRQKWVNPVTVWLQFERACAPPKPEVTKAKPKSYKAEVARLVEENDRLKRSGGSRFDFAKDRAEDCIIAIVGMVEDRSLAITKLERILRGVAERLKEIKAKHRQDSAAGS